jgi:hypothetical protein
MPDLFCNHSLISFDDLFLNPGNSLINQINPNATFILGTLLWESAYNLTKESILFLLEAKKHNLPIVVLANSMIANSDVAHVLHAFDCKIIFIDFFFWRVYREIVVKKKNKVNPAWNSAASKYLFLPGKPNKPFNRITLLWDLHQKNLLSDCIWSLHVCDGHRPSILHTLIEHGVDVQQAKSFIEKFQSNPDQVEFSTSPYGYGHYGGIPYSIDLYAKSKFRLVVETNFRKKQELIWERNLQLPWITEKTWLTVINRCPFIMAGDQGTLRYLESQGFRTFHQYQKFPDYDNITNTQQRLTAIVENTQTWLTSQDHLESIRNDVEHNYNLFVELGQKMEKKILQDLQNLNLLLDLDSIPTMDNISGF